MKEYWMTLMAVALLNGIMGILSPEGEMKKYVRLLGALCLLCVMTRPVLGLLSAEDGWLKKLWESGGEQVETEYDEIYNESLMNGGEKYAEDVIRNQVLQRFELPDGSVDVHVQMKMKNDKCELQEVELTIRNEAVFADPRELISYINETFSCPCAVIYGS